MASWWTTSSPCCRRRSGTATLGEALVEVPDHAHCDELPSADHRHRDELIEIHRRDEADNSDEAPW
jgi:hypothetical protein